MAEFPRVSPRLPRDSSEIPQRLSEILQDFSEMYRENAPNFSKKILFSFVIYDTRTSANCQVVFVRPSGCATDSSIRIHPRAGCKHFCHSKIRFFPKMHALHNSLRANIFHQVGTKIALLGGWRSDISRVVTHVARTTLFHKQKHCKAKCRGQDRQSNLKLILHKMPQINLR